jgi:flagellar basal body-associated protein FliL
MAEEAKKKAEAPAAEKSSDKKDAGKGPSTTGAAAAAAAHGGGGLLTKTPVLLGGVMVLEAALLFAGFKFLGAGPRQSPGAELAAEDPAAAAPAADEHGAAKSGHESAPSGEHGAATAGGGAKIDKKKSVEVPVLDFQALNKQSGRTFLYNVTIVAVTKGEFKERVDGAINERKALISDRIRTIIAQCDPEKLGGSLEPGLETLRRQIKYQLDEIVGEGMIDEVLVPRCIPIRADY